MAPRYKYVLRVTLRTGRTHDVIYPTQIACVDDYDALLAKITDTPTESFIKISDNDRVIALRSDDIESMTYSAVETT